MDITLTPQQKQYIAGMLAGFLDQLELPLAGNHPKAVEAAILQALIGMADDWARIGWPERSMLQIAIASGIQEAYVGLQRKCAGALGDFAKKLK